MTLRSGVLWRACAGLIRAVGLVARLIGAAEEDVVPVQNATTAASVVLAAVGRHLTPQDVIMVFNTTYPAVRHACQVPVHAHLCQFRRLLKT